MARTSANIKGWLLPVVTASYGYALTTSTVNVALLGITATLIFAYMDTGYLATERRYHRLYELVAAGDSSVRPFSLNYEEHKNLQKIRAKDRSSALFSWSMLPFYGSMLAVGLTVLGRLAW